MPHSTGKATFLPLSMRRNSDKHAKVPMCGLKDTGMMALIHSTDLSTERTQQDQISAVFFTNLALCHTCIAELQKFMDTAEASSDAASNNDSAPLKPLNTV